MSKPTHPIANVLYSSWVFSETPAIVLSEGLEGTSPKFQGRKTKKQVKVPRSDICEPGISSSSGHEAPRGIGCEHSSLNAKLSSQEPQKTDCPGQALLKAALTRTIWESCPFEKPSFCARHLVGLVIEGKGNVMVKIDI